MYAVVGTCYIYAIIMCTLYQGGWVLLQNCHLGLEFMDELLNTIMEAESMHESCRIWITTEVHPKFPISLLQVIIIIWFMDECQV